MKSLSTLGGALRRALAVGSIVASVTLNACSNGVGNTNTAIPTGSSNRISRQALDNIFGRPIGSHRGVVQRNALAPVPYTVDDSTPASDNTYTRTGIARWTTFSTSYQLTGAGTVDCVSVIATLDNGHKVWELDLQASQTLGVSRIWTSDGGYVGVWTNNTLNIASPLTQYDKMYLMMLNGDITWAQNGYPSADRIPIPKVNVKFKGKGWGKRHLHPASAATHSLTRLGIVGGVAGTAVGVTCIFLEPCPALVAVAGLAYAAVSGTVAYVADKLQEMEEEGHTTGGGSVDPPSVIIINNPGAPLPAPPPQGVTGTWVVTYTVVCTGPTPSQLVCEQRQVNWFYQTN